MTSNTKQRDQAEAQFKKAQRAKDAEAAMSEYESEARAVREKTARLRLLRLAKEAAAKDEAAKLANAGKKPAARRKQPRSAQQTTTVPGSAVTQPDPTAA